MLGWEGKAAATACRLGRVVGAAACKAPSRLDEPVGGKLVEPYPEETETGKQNALPAW